MESKIAPAPSLIKFMKLIANYYNSPSIDTQNATSCAITIVEFRSGSIIEYMSELF